MAQRLAKKGWQRQHAAAIRFDEKLIWKINVAAAIRFDETTNMENQCTDRCTF